MAVKPSNAALAALRNTRRAKQEELGRAYEAMGGSNTALVSNSQFAPNTIPSLKRNIENRYAEAQNAAGNALDRDSQAYANLQSMTPAYNDYKIRETEEILNRLGQTDIARGSNSLSVERAKEGHLQSGLVNSLSENEKLGRILTSLTGSSAPYQAYKQMENEAMKGTLTDEMKAAGLTQEDIDRWNRQQNNAERQQALTDYATQHPFLATVNSFPEMAAGSAEGVLDKLANYVQGKPLESSPINAELYRNAATQNMSGLGNFAYGVGTSIGDMLLASTAGGVGGPGIMGLEKANSVMNDAIERGLTPNQILAEGVGSGVSTGLTEAIPFGRFQRGGHIAGSALAEGLQEGSEDIVDTILDELITRAGGNNEKSIWNRNLQAYRDAGYSEEDAKKAVVVDYLKQLGMDSLAGAISGGAMQGGTNVLNQRNFITGKPRVNAENNVETDTNAVSDELPVLRDSRAEEAAIQSQRNAELALLTEAVAQMQNQQSIPAVENTQQNYDPEEMEYLRNALLDANRVQANPAYRANPENVIYHAGKLSRLNKAETNGRFSGSNRGTGYFGTGHYFVDNNTLNELEGSGYGDLPLSSVDISGYNNLFRADTDAKANNLHNFLQDMTRLTQGSDKVSMTELYDEYIKAFKDQNNIIPYDDFANRINSLTEYMRNSNMEDRGDSVSTQFMKSLGYGGVDTRGTRYADTRYGTVIYDLDENSVLQSNIPALQRATTDMLARNQNRNVFDVDEDARIQKILDSQAKRAEVEARFHELYDDTEIKENDAKIQQLQNEQQNIQDIIDDISSVVNDPEKYVRGLEKDYAEFGLPTLTDEERASEIERVRAEFTESLDRRKAELSSIKEQISALTERNNALYDDANKIYQQAREDVENSKQTNDTYEPVSGLTFGTAHITNNYVDIDGYSNRKSEKALLNQLAKAVEPYSKSEAENLRNSVKFNEIVQYPGSQGNNEYILEWENVPGASRNVDADDIDVLLSNREDTYENSSTEEAPANYYVHVRFPIDALNEGYQRNNEQTVRDNEGLPKDVANLTEENVGQALGDELEKLNASHPFKLDLFAEKGGEEELPVLKNEVHTGNYKTSKFATNTFPNSGVMTESEYSEVIPEDIKKYEAVTHEATLNAAEKNIKENGYTGEYNRLLKDNKWDAVDVDTAMMCAMREAENARNAEALGIDPNEAWGREVEIFKKARSQATTGGQMIEAFKKWSAMTPEGKLGQAIAHVNETVKEVKNKNNPESKNGPKIPTAAERYLTDEFMAEFLKKAHQYDGQDVSLLKQARLNAELAHMVNEQIPVQFRQKFTSLWMDNLLASFRTLISRNFGGNIGKAALDQTIVKALSGPIDNFMSRYTGTRTTTGFTKEGLKTYLKGFKEGAGQTLKDYWTPNADPDAKLKLNNLAKEIDVFADANVTNRSGVNETSFKESLDNNRITFKNKALKLYDKVIKFGLAIGDNPFYKATYDQTVQELNTLREQGKLKLPEDITDEQFETWVKAVATAQGLEAVYQDNTELAEGASDIKNGLAKMSKGYVGFDFLSGASMPFVRTPMNVIKTNLELSPLGIVKNTVNTVKEIRANLEANRSAFDTASFDQRRFVRETSRNIVGLLMFATGLMLKNAGMLTGGYSEDKKEAQAQKDSGMQEYAWVSPFSGNQYSIDWLPGIGSSFISASAFEDAFNRPDQDVLDALINGAKAGSASMFEQAALQGLRRLTGADTVSSSSDNIIDNVVQTVANTASSAIVPSFVRQSAAALDPYKRNTYGMGGKESILNNAIAGIPFLRQTLEPRIGLNGEPMAQNAGRNGFEKWFDNLVNPAQVTVPSALENPVRDEAMRLYNETKNYTAFQPKISLSYLNVDGHQATTEEYTRFLQIADSAMNQVATDFIQSDYYQTLSDEEKEKDLGEIYSAIQTVERAKFLDLDTKFDGKEKAYAEGGEEGLINYFRAKDTLNSIGATNNPQNRDQVLQVFESSPDTMAQMQDMGFDMNMIKRYNHASERIPSLDPVSFEQQFRAIDQQNPGESGYGSIKQSEIIDYLNQNPSAYNDSQAFQIWDAYLQSYSKVPVLDPESGTWSAK